MSKTKHLEGKTAIITGASRGIGRQIALKLAQEGANIVFNYSKSREQAETLLQELSNLGVKALCFAVNVNDFKKVQEMKEKILAQFERIDILINNAGITRDKSLAMMSEEDWDAVMETNLKGTFNITKAFIFTFMKQKKGNIINVSSLSGIIGIPGQTNYSASKGGIISFTRSLAKEVAAFNIRVNAIAPGFIESDMLNHLNKEKIIGMIPLQRLGTAQEVADLVNFLLKEESNYITGQVIQIDGGLGI